MMKHGDTVWDTLTKKEIHIDDIVISDNKRYLSMISGKPIVVVKEHIKTSKKGTKYSVRKHIANKAEDIVYVHRGESEIHKAAKELFKEFKEKDIVLRVPSIQYLYTTHCTKTYIDVINNSNIKIIELLSIEKKDENSKYIPDLKVLANIDGVIQPLYIEIRYSHPVDYEKKQNYIKNKINCIEIDIREMENYKDIADEIFNTKLLNIIQNNSKWISNFNSIVTSEWLENNIQSITHKNGLVQSYKHQNNYNLRYYVEKETLGLKRDDERFKEQSRDKYKTCSMCDCESCGYCVHCHNDDTFEKSEILCKVTPGKVLNLEDIVYSEVQKIALQRFKEYNI